MKTRQEILREVASLYDDQERAYELLNNYDHRRLRGKMLYEFATRCTVARLKREMNGVAHSASLLEIELEAMAEEERTPNFSGKGHVRRKQTLDEIDRDYGWANIILKNS